jgi:hypothetical protein
VWLPLQLVLEFLGRSALWLAVMAGFGVAAALLVAPAARRPLQSAWPWVALGGALGAILGASLADRFGLPEALTFSVWRRAVPAAWAGGGALLGAAAAAAFLWSRRPATRLEAATPPEGSEGSPTGDAAPPSPGAGTPL